MTNEYATALLFVVGMGGIGLTDIMMWLMKPTKDPSTFAHDFGPVLTTLWILWLMLGIIAVAVIRIASAFFLLVALVGALSILGWL